MALLTEGASCSVKSINIALLTEGELGMLRSSPPRESDGRHCFRCDELSTLETNLLKAAADHRVDTVLNAFL
jgi:hypothetical protein